MDEKVIEIRINNNVDIKNSTRERENYHNLRIMKARCREVVNLELLIYKQKGIFPITPKG